MSGPDAQYVFVENGGIVTKIEGKWMRVDYLKWRFEEPNILYVDNTDTKQTTKHTLSEKEVKWMKGES